MMGAITCTYASIHLSLTQIGKIQQHAIHVEASFTGALHQGILLHLCTQEASLFLTPASHPKEMFVSTSL